MCMETVAYPVLKSWDISHQQSFRKRGRHRSRESNDSIVLVTPIDSMSLKHYVALVRITPITEGVVWPWWRRAKTREISTLTSEYTLHYLSLLTSLGRHWIGLHPRANNPTRLGWSGCFLETTRADFHPLHRPQEYEDAWNHVWLAHRPWIPNRVQRRYA